MRRASDGEGTKPISDLGDAELFEQLAEAKEELFNLRFQHVTGQLENTARLGEVTQARSPGSTPSCASREIAAAEALAAERRRRDG